MASPKKAAHNPVQRLSAFGLSLVLIMAGNVFVQRLSAFSAMVLDRRQASVLRFSAVTGRLILPVAAAVSGARLAMLLVISHVVLTSSVGSDGWKGRPACSFG